MGSVPRVTICRRVSELLNVNLFNNPTTAGIGAVGKTLVRDLLHNGGFSKITTVGRREFEYDGPNKDILVS